jgi:hypothetical protein
LAGRIPAAALGVFAGAAFFAAGALRAAGLALGAGWVLGAGMAHLPWCILNRRYSAFEDKKPMPWRRETIKNFYF